MSEEKKKSRKWIWWAAVSLLIYSLLFGPVTQVALLFDVEVRGFVILAYLPFWLLIERHTPARDTLIWYLDFGNA